MTDATDPAAALADAAAAAAPDSEAPPAAAPPSITDAQLRGFHAHCVVKANHETAALIRAAVDGNGAARVQCAVLYAEAMATPE